MEAVKHEHPATAWNSGRIITQPSAKLKYLKIILAKKFSSISIHETISRYGVPFLHIWKPICRSEGVQGMEFLPCFHIIVTITNERAGIQVPPKDTGENTDSVLFQLHSFHGKVLAEELHGSNKCDHSTYFDLISRMAGDKLKLCHGIDEIDKEPFMNFMQTCDLPLLNKFKSVFLIEQFMGTILVRSRLCKFVLNDDDNSLKIRKMGNGEDTNNSFRCCEECASLQFNTQYNQAHNRENKSEVAQQNGFQKVFSQTSMSDMEALALIQRANEFPSFLSKHIPQCTEKEFKLEVDTANSISCKISDHDNQIKKEPNTDLNAVDGTNKVSEAAETRHSNILSHETHSYANEYDYHANEFTGEQDGSDTLCIKGSGDIENTDNDDNFYLEDHQHLETDSYLDMNMLNDSADQYCNSTPAPESRRLRKKKTPYMEIHADIYEPQYSIPIKDRIERKQIRLSWESLQDKKRGIVKGIQSKKQSRRGKQERKQRDGGDVASTGKKEFRRTCMICLYEFQSECNFNTDQLRHQQSFEDMEQSVPCPLCHESIETKYLITTHFEEKHSNQNVTCCCECLEIIPKGSNRLRRHILKSHHSATEKQVCPECGQECAGNAKLEIHMAEAHGDKKAAVCEECGKTFGHLKVYKQHLRRHHNPRDLQCAQCDKKFEHRQQAIDHLVVHTGIKPYKCVQCNYVSYRISNVICIHFVKCHGRKGISATDLSTDIVERDRMMEIARAGVQKMVNIRDLQLKKEIDR